MEGREKRRGGKEIVEKTAVCGEKTGSRKEQRMSCSPVVGGGNHQTKFTECNYAGQLIPMNSQLNVEVADKKRGKRRYCPRLSGREDAGRNWGNSWSRSHE